MQRITLLSMQLLRSIRQELQVVGNQQCCSNFCTSKSILKLQKMDGTDHLSRTLTNTRDDGIHSMSVKAITKLSPTVKEIVLVSEKIPVPFSFKAGQWVDVFIPGVETVGGFSMISSPQELTNDGFLRLAIKYSTHPPALWMHQQCKVGDELRIRVGGDFYLSHDKLKKPINKILLVAGGVGINPLSSMIHYVMKTECSLRQSTKLNLVYSAKTKDELIFKEAFDNYQKLDSNFLATYFLTAETASQSEGFNYRRICSTDLESSIDWLADLDQKSNHESVDAYICGPPGMIAEVKDDLCSLNVTSIHFEKWW